MKTKTLKKISTVVAIIGFIIMLGTAGAMEIGDICLTQVCVQLVIGLLMILSGLVGCVL